MTSSNKDPLLTNANKKFSVYNIGSKTIRTIFFATLDVKVVVMTMPDLHNYHIKRSNNSVHYVYLPHSLLSTHMVYRKGAFDFYDSFFWAPIGGIFFTVYGSILSFFSGGPAQQLHRGQCFSSQASLRTIQKHCPVLQRLDISR